MEEDDDLTETWESAYHSIILEKGENIVASWWGNRETCEKVILEGSSVEQKTRKRGLLVLTNRRLLFLDEHGVFGKSYHQTLSILVEKVDAISMGGTFMPFVSIADGVVMHVFHIDGVGKNEFESFKQTIVEQCQKRSEEIAKEKKKERVQIVLDFSALREYMEKGGLVLRKTKCPECGANIPLPDAGNQTKCKHCGSVIYAQDIFEKIKSLI